VVVAVVRFDETTRTIIDGRPAGFCKLIADRVSRLDVRWRHKARIE
jgi:dihydrolipoamide dehydrogenase